MKLIPPDYKQCQAEVRSYHPFQMGGEVYGTKRCESKPTVIITECKKNEEDGKKGSMSLCDDCLIKATKKLGKNYFTIKKLSRAVIMANRRSYD